MEKDVEGVEETEKALPQKHVGLGIRHLVVFMMFLCLGMAYALRVILSVTIVAMCSDCGNNTINEKFPTYEWKSQKDTILSSFFWGYVVTQVPSGVLASYVGGKPLLVVGMGITSIITLLTPLAADYGWGYMCAGRVLQGLAQGVVFPSIHTLLSKWAPPQERGRLGTFAYAGAQAGTVVGLPLSGVLAESSIGWPSVFYIFGGVGVLWAICWFFLGASSPATHRWCSSEECNYIQTSLNENVDSKRPPTPWLRIFTSLPMWSLIIVHCGQNWGFWTLLTEMPSYMDGVLGFDLKSNGLLSALPYLVMWLLSFVFSWVSDKANERKLFSLTVSRKIFNTIGHWIPALALLGVGYVKDEVSAVALLTVAVGFDSATYVGFQVNHIDMSPNFAGTMMGITNCAANIMSIIGPLIVGVLVTENNSTQQWRTVFFIASAIYFLGNLMFILFGTAETQSWNFYDGNKGQERTQNEEKESEDTERTEEKN